MSVAQNSYKASLCDVLELCRKNRSKESQIRFAVRYDTTDSIFLQLVQDIQSICWRV